jgi:hypothetical protein
MVDQPIIVTAPVTFAGSNAQDVGDQVRSALGRAQVVIVDLTATWVCDLSAIGEQCIAHQLASESAKELLRRRNARQLRKQCSRAIDLSFLRSAWKPGPGLVVQGRGQRWEGCPDPVNAHDLQDSQHAAGRHDEPELNTRFDGALASTLDLANTAGVTETGHGQVGDDMPGLRTDDCEELRVDVGGVRQVNLARQFDYGCLGSAFRAEHRGTAFRRWQRVAIAAIG